MRKLIEYTQENLIECDNIGCDFVIPTKDVPNSDGKEYIGVPCPQCGENLLTEKDYLDDKKLVMLIDKINKWFSWMTIFIHRGKEVLTEIKVHNGVKIQSYYSKLK